MALHAEVEPSTSHFAVVPERVLSSESVSQAPLVQGSDEWLRLRFSAWAEVLGMERVRSRLQGENRMGDIDPIIEKWMFNQIYYFLTEFGAGRLLPIQPSYQAEIEVDEDGRFSVYALNLQDYGEQKRSYVSFDGVDVAVRDGLVTAYSTLSTMNPGEGLFRLSPSEYYTAFGSTYDVIEFYRVVEKKESGGRLIEGRYLILDRILSSQERTFIVNQNDVSGGAFITNTSGTEIIRSTPESIVRNPQMTIYEPTSADPILDKIWQVASSYTAAYGKPLVSETDFFMYEKIQERVAENMPLILELCSKSQVDDREMIALLRSMMFSSQKQWAEMKGLDPDEHIQKIIDGEIVIGFETMSDFDDPVAVKALSKKKEVGFCEIHLKRFVGKCLECEMEREFVI